MKQIDEGLKIIVLSILPVEKWEDKKLINHAISAIQKHYKKQGYRKVKKPIPLPEDFRKDGITM